MLIPTKEVAKQVRKDLKQLHPGIKFSVRSIPDSLFITFVGDVVSRDNVMDIALKYCGRSDWDSIYCDYQTNSPVLFNGILVWTSLVYVFVGGEVEG